MKRIIDGSQFVHGSDNGNYIKIELEADVEETIKISECEDNDEFVMTGKQLKELQSFWKKVHIRGEA